jgi:hypothetical protein
MTYVDRDKIGSCTRYIMKQYVQWAKERINRGGIRKSWASRSIYRDHLAADFQVSRGPAVTVQVVMIHRNEPNRSPCIMTLDGMILVSDANQREWPKILTWLESCQWAAPRRAGNWVLRAFGSSVWPARLADFTHRFYIGRQRPGSP